MSPDHGQSIDDAGVGSGQFHSGGFFDEPGDSIAGNRHHSCPPVGSQATKRESCDLGTLVGSVAPFERFGGDQVGDVGRQAAGQGVGGECGHAVSVESGLVEASSECVDATGVGVDADQPQLALPGEGFDQRAVVDAQHQGEAFGRAGGLEDAGGFCQRRSLGSSDVVGQFARPGISGKAQ